METAKTIYVCTYFNEYQNNTRKHVAQSFLSSYPWITLIEAVYGGVENGLTHKGKTIKVIMLPEHSHKFVDYILINRFIRMLNSDNPGERYNLVVIDCDLYLPDEFRDRMELALQSNGIVHGFDTAIMEGEDNPIVPSIYKSGTYGHTGFIYGFSADFLEVIDYKFLEDFTIGGFDYILAMGLLRKPMVFTERFTFAKELKQWIDKLLVNNVTFTYLPGVIIRHQYHGPARQRLTPFSFYNSIDQVPKNVFMKTRSNQELS